MPVDAKPAVFWRDLELKQKVFVEITTEQGIRVERLVVQSIGPSAHPELLHIIFPFGISRFAPKNLLIDSPLTLRIAELCRAAAEQALFERKLGEMQQEAERIATVTVLQASAVDVGQVVRCLATRSGMRDPWLEVTEIARESISDDSPRKSFSPACRIASAVTTAARSGGCTGRTNCLSSRPATPRLQVHHQANEPHNPLDETSESRRTSASDRLLGIYCGEPSVMNSTTTLPASMIRARMRNLLAKFGAESLVDAAEALKCLIEERQPINGNHEQRIFGRIMDLAVDDAPMVAMLAILAPSVERFPPAGIPVDQIAALQDELSSDQLTQRMEAACRDLCETSSGT